MKIEGEDYMLEYDEDCNRFDLYINYIKNAKNPEKRSEELKLYGYGMPLDHCIKKIINYRISKNKETLTLQDYLVQFKKESDKLVNLTKLL